MARVDSFFLAEASLAEASLALELVVLTPAKPFFSCFSKPRRSTTPRFVTVAFNSSAWHFDELPLSCGVTCYAAVRATNCAGLQQTVASEGAKLCCDKPRTGSIQVVDERGAPVRFVGSSRAVHTFVTWSGFEEPCSGLRAYNVTLQVGGFIIWSSTFDRFVSQALLPANVLQAIPHGNTTVVTVTAVSHSNQLALAHSDMTIDRTPAAGGVAFNSDMTDITCQLLTEPFQVSWEGIEDVESGISSIEWSLGLRPFADDLMSSRRVDHDDVDGPRRRDK